MIFPRRLNFDDESIEDNSVEHYHIPPKVVHRLPSFSLFCESRHHKWFDKVKEKPTHYHARCTRCTELQESCRDGWRNGVDVEVFQKELSLHKEEVRKWRELETNLQNKARHDPNFVVLSYDDTSALQLPKFTKRGLKNMPFVTLDYVPWNVINHGTGENAYFYTFKEDVSKGGNRICTFLYSILRRIKFSESHRQKMARHLVLMGDNYIENKCNTLMAFGALLVNLGWFDTVEFLFGPVGHTHNGNDSVHNCHNNLAADYNCFTLPDFIQKFDYAWIKEQSRPQAVFFEDLYDWDTWLGPYMDPVSGLPATAHSELYVRAIKLQIGHEGKVEMHVKGSPAILNGKGLEHLTKITLMLVQLYLLAFQMAFRPSFPIVPWQNSLKS